MKELSSIESNKQDKDEFNKLSLKFQSKKIKLFSHFLKLLSSLTIAFGIFLKDYIPQELSISLIVIGSFSLFITSFSLIKKCLLKLYDMFKSKKNDVDILNLNYDGFNMPNNIPKLDNNGVLISNYQHNITHEDNAGDDQVIGPLMER